MASRESVGLVAMTLAFLLVVGGVGGVMLFQYMSGADFRGGGSADTLISRGQTAANRGDFATAVDLMAAAIAADPSSPEAYFVRGDLFYRMGDQLSAHDDYCAAIERDANSTRALMARARVRLEMNKTDDALADYAHVLATDPTHTGALRARAGLLRSRGAYAAAASDLEKVLAIDPGARDIDRAIAWAHWGAGDYNAALASYDRAIGRRSPSMHDYFGRGVTLYHLGRFSEARQDLERGVRRRRAGYDYAAYYLWLTLAQLDRKQEADAMLKEFQHGDRSSDWSKQIHRFLVGEIDEDQFIDHASAGTWQPAEEQLCEAHFYAGTMRLLESDRAAAADHFRRGVETGVSNFYEFFSSMEELRKLEQEKRPGHTAGS